MDRRFRFLDDIVTADIAFEATGDSPAELFAAAAQALIETMADPAAIGSVWRRRIDRQEDSLESLLFEWLSELVYLKDAEGVLFHEVEVLKVEEVGPERWQLSALVHGEPIDPTRFELRADVKAVTKHLFGVRREGGRYVARVVLDV